MHICVFVQNNIVFIYQISLLKGPMVHIVEPISISGRDGGRKKASEDPHQLFVALFLAELDDACNVVPGLGKMGIGVRVIQSLIVLRVSRITIAGKGLDLNCLVSYSSSGCAPCSLLCTNLVSF